MIQLIVFDMAGTTVDEDNLVYKTIHNALQEAGHSFSFEEVLREAAGKEKWAAIRDLLVFHGDVNDAEVDQIYERFQTSLREAYHTFPMKPQAGAEEVFQELQHRGIKVVLNTGYNREIVDLILNRLGWTGHPNINASISADDVQQGRPAPDMIYLAMEKTGVTDPKLVGKIGDSMIDIEEGRNAGCGLLIGVTTGAHTPAQLASVNPSYILDRLTDLLPLV